MTTEQENVLQQLYNEWRQITGSHKLVGYPPIRFLAQQQRELFVGWVLETITPAMLEEFLGRTFDKPTSATEEPTKETVQ